MQSLGGGWQNIAPSMEGISYSGIWGETEDDFFVVGSEGTIARYRDGQPWETWRLQSGANLESIWGTHSGNIFAAGDAGTIVHFDGVSWETMDSGTTQALSAVHGRNSQEVYAVGADGSILFFNGSAWRSLDSGTELTLNGVWCREDGQTVVVGSGGLVLNQGDELGEDTPWLVQDGVSLFSLYDVTGDGEGNTYAVGYNGTVVMYDGLNWQPVHPGRHDLLYAVDLDPCGSLVAAGDWGLVLQYGY